MLTILWVATGENQRGRLIPQTLYVLCRGFDTHAKIARKVSIARDQYQTLDKNADGQIGLSEWDRAKYAEFRKLDKNRDGFLTPLELTGTATVIAGAGGAAKGGDSKDSKELENPGNLVTYKEKIKSTYSFKVTGKVGGTVLGTGPYAVESDLAAAAVHAGILKDGAKGTVKITIVENTDGFGGSAMNGVTSTERDEEARFSHSNLRRRGQKRSSPGPAARLRRANYGQFSPCPKLRIAFRGFY